MIVLKHIENGFPEQLQILFGEAGGFARQIGRNVALCPVQRVGNDVFPAHFGAFVLRIGLGGDGHAGDGHFLRHDGVYAAGIRALAVALHGKHEVTIAAPSVQRSGASHSFTCSEFGLSAERVTLEGLEDVTAYAISGTPSDCAKLGMQLMGEWPDLVVSGINHGSNLGTDTLYSGTVGAAMEAAIYGVKAIAVSNYAFEPENFDMCIYGLERAMQLMEEHNELMLLNVNAPDGAREECKGVKLTPLGFHKYPTEYDLMPNENGEEMFYSRRGIVYMSRENDDVDDRWLQKGYVSITPLQMSFTDENMLALLKKGWRE